MNPTRLLCCLATLILLAGCATAPEPAKAPPTLGALLQDAEAALKNGHQQQALAIFHGASLAYPRNKAAFMRIAQIQFECHNYGETIASAQQVLERDPDDMLAHSLVAVSGLRVSSKALSDLTIKNHLTGSVRAEAQDLAKLLRASIGGDIILPAPKAKPATIEAMK
ncbi:tetratricopeptide repeat protein [Massilia sp. CF038]|uniref:tetratricopeptide repeat protein n=1 Tax=Massilia sp. CF038 TaxID=1881045 RepID=UPI00091DCB9F|nr:tetratricopeptide repeat protein [Massilia sp. CF038]SHH02112.1 Tetratricopeptide repeat-containing protein [Massilia sp. CF038]